jgi:outer membrane protein assembly factor BamE (lipoprotein component of BamABCDE complex)
MKLYKLGEIAFFVSLAVTSVLLIGCVVSDTDEQYTGVGDDTLKQIRCGRTTRDQLVATLGEPCEQQVTDNGTEILKYKCTIKKDNQFVLFPVVIVNDKEQAEYTVAFEIKDGIVQRYWKEG